MDKQDDLPWYPPLEKCLVLDARLASRKSIVKDIQDTTLFNNAVEAESLAGGVEFLATRAVDACFLGPGISSASAANFVRQGLANRFSKKCAFITFVSRNGAQRAELEAAGSHRIIQSPYEKDALADSIVAGVIKADPEGMWAVIYREFQERKKSAGEARSTAVEEPQLGATVETTDVDRFEPHSKQADVEQPSPVPEQTKDTKPSQSDAQRLGAALLSAAPHMKTLAARVQSGELGLDQNDNPTGSSRAALRELVDTIIADAYLEERIEEFRHFFESALDFWFFDVCRLGSKAAADNLKLRLVELAAEE